MNNQFRVILARKKLNISEVFENTGIAKTTLYGLYKETTKNPNTKTVMKLCEYLEVTPNDFLELMKVW